MYFDDEIIITLDLDNTTKENLESPIIPESRGLKESKANHISALFLLKNDFTQDYSANPLDDQDQKKNLFLLKTFDVVALAFSIFFFYVLFGSYLTLVPHIEEVPFTLDVSIFWKIALFILVSASLFRKRTKEDAHGKRVRELISIFDLENLGKILGSKKYGYTMFADHYRSRNRNEAFIKKHANIMLSLHIREFALRVPMLLFYAVFIFGGTFVASSLATSFSNQFMGFLGI